MSELLEPGGQEDTGRLVRLAYGSSVDVDTAARHLWRLHREARVRRAQRVRRTLSSALAATLLFVSTGAAVASSGGSVPGDTLYPVKRGAERVHLLVSFAPESDARLHLKFARARLAEAQRVAGSRPQRVPALLGEVVAAVGRAEAVGGTVVVDEVDLVRAEVSAALPTLSASVDADVAAALDELAGELDDPGLAGGSGEEQPGGAGVPAGDSENEAPADSGVPAAPDHRPSPDRSVSPAATAAPEAPAEEADVVALAEVPPESEARDSTPVETEVAPLPPPPDPAVSEAAPAKAMPDIERLEAMLNDRDGS